MKYPVFFHFCCDSGRGRLLKGGDHIQIRELRGLAGGNSFQDAGGLCLQVRAATTPMKIRIPPSAFKGVRGSFRKK